MLERNSNQVAHDEAIERKIDDGTMSYVLVGNSRVPFSTSTLEEVGCTKGQSVDVNIALDLVKVEMSLIQTKMLMLKINTEIYAKKMANT